VSIARYRTDLLVQKQARDEQARKLRGQGYSYSQIAEILGVNTQTAWNAVNPEAAAKSGRARQARYKAKEWHKANRKTLRGWATKTASSIRERDHYSTVTADDLVDLFNSCDGKCERPDCMAALSIGTGNRAFTPQVDRILLDRPYSRINIQLLCREHNRHKDNMSSVEMRFMLEHQLLQEARVRAAGSHG
jgi:hypothetical protein